MKIHLTQLTAFKFRTLTLSMTLAMAAFVSSPLAFATNVRPPLMLANIYHSGVVLSDYWVSEKYDGVRGYWDGEKLLTRGGERIAVPVWFTENWPKTAMDGELWAGRGQFAKALSTVRQQTPDDAAWRTMRFMVFDLPAQQGPFIERISVLNGLVSQIDQPWVQAVLQSKVLTHQALKNLLLTSTKQGAEGLMLHRSASLYKGQRSDDLMKVKTHEDTEARVIAHIPGKGKYAGVLGALLMEIPAAGGRPAQRFKLGTGFTDAQRQSPPAVGTVVTYRFRGLNEGGIPRFASFMRVFESQSS